ncbi:TPA: hypothetical protein ACGQ6D_001858 [Escherichia coli]
MVAFYAVFPTKRLAHLSAGSGVFSPPAPLWFHSLHLFKFSNPCRDLAVIEKLFRFSVNTIGLHKAKGRVGVRGQAVIIILLGLIVAKLYPTLSMVFFAIIGAAIFTYIIKHTALWFYKIDIVQKFVRPVSMLLLALIPIGVAYVIDVFYPSDTERWLIVLYCYIGVALFCGFHWCFEKINDSISKNKD